MNSDLTSTFFSFQLTLGTRLNGYMMQLSLSGFIVFEVNTKVVFSAGCYTSTRLNEYNSDGMVKCTFKDIKYFRYDKVAGIMTYESSSEDDNILSKCHNVGNKHASNVKSRSHSRMINIHIINNNDSINGEINLKCRLGQEFWYIDCCINGLNNLLQKMIESKYFETTTIKISQIYTVAVLMNIYDLVYHKERYYMIELTKYKGIKDFVIINSDDIEHTLKIVWKLACIININIENEKNDIRIHRQKVFNEYQLYC